MSEAPTDSRTAAPARPRAAFVTRSKAAALAVIAIAQLLIVLDGTIVAVALPSAEVDLGISAANRSWVVTIYALTFGGLLLLGGRVADFIGRRRSLVIGLLGFAGASLVGAFAVNAPMLFAARGLQGAFAAVLAPSALSLLAVTFAQGSERTRAFAVFGAVAGAGGAAGLLLGGVLTEFLSWRWCLGVATPVAVATAIAARIVFQEYRSDAPRRYDIAGGLTVTAGLAALVLGLGEADTAGWSSPVTTSLLATSVILLAAFVIVESRSAAPLLPLRVVLDRNRGGAFLVQICIGAALLAVFVFLTFYLQQTLGFTPLQTGLAFLPVAVGIVIGALSYTALANRLRPGLQILIGALFAAAGLALLTRLGVDSDYWTDILPALLVMAGGVGLTAGPVSNIALIGVRQDDAGVASALVDTTQQVGGAIGTALLNTVFAGVLTGYLASRGDVARSDLSAQIATVDAYHVVFWTGAAILTVGAALPVVLITATKQQLADTVATTEHG